MIGYHPCTSRKWPVPNVTRCSLLKGATIRKIVKHKLEGLKPWVRSIWDAMLCLRARNIWEEKAVPFRGNFRNKDDDMKDRITRHPVKHRELLIAKATELPKSCSYRC